MPTRLAPAPAATSVVASAEQLNSPDTVCLAVTGAAGKKNLARRPRHRRRPATMLAF